MSRPECRDFATAPHAAYTQPAMATTPAPRGTKALWVIVALVLLGLAPFLIAAFVARSARAKALTDPAARRLLTDDEAPPTGR